MAHGGWVAAEENIKIKELKKRKSERRTVCHKQGRTS